MTMSPPLRRLALTAHVAVSVGWLGAVVLVLALAAAVLTSPDEDLVRAAQLVLAWAGWTVLVPLAAATLATGVLQALGTPWGLFRHWWVVVKLVLTVLATAVLLLYTRTLDELGAAAADPGAAVARSASPLLHSVGALVVLLGALVLSVHKPAGLTRYGWRVRQRRSAHL